MSRLANSINSKLFIPLLVTFLLAIILFFVAISIRTSELIEQRVQDRAYELAESFAVATEINASHANFVRIVNSIGAYDDIEKIFLLDDEKEHVIASSRNQYTSKSIDQLKDELLKQQLLTAVRLHTSQFIGQTHQENIFAYKLQTIAPDKSSLRPVTLFMKIDVSGIKTYIRSISLYFLTGMLVILLILLLVSFLFIRNIVLGPIYKLVSSIKQTKRQNAPVISRYQSKDQLGVLTRVYNELILDSFSKQRELTIEREKSIQASRAKSQFLAMMTHELRTPLNGVIGMTGKLGELITEPEQQKYLQVIRMSANQLLNIINDTLDFSKIEANKLVLDNQPFDLVALTKGLAVMFQIQLENKPVKLQIHVPDESVPIVLGDSVRLIQVIVNLLGNAIKFTESGQIDVTLRVASQQTEKLMFTLTIKDTGIGLSESQVKNLFTEFTQADSSTTRKYGGTGLGLWISKKLIDKMGGEITVNSVLGEGTEFSISLSLDISDVLIDNAHIDQQSMTEHLEQLSDLKILLVEDTEINRMVVQAILDIENIQIVTAENGVEGVKQFQQQNFDLILMDCLMPVMDGFEASVQIRKIESVRREQEGITKRIPIVALTANALEETRQQCLESGMDEFLTKPVIPDLLKKSVIKWCG